MFASMFSSAHSQLHQPPRMHLTFLHSFFLLHCHQLSVRVINFIYSLFAVVDIYLHASYTVVKHNIQTKQRNQIASLLHAACGQNLRRASLISTNCGPVLLIKHLCVRHRLGELETVFNFSRN